MPPKKNSLVRNINKRKKAGTSRSKKNTTVSKKAYSDMKKGWPKKKKKKQVNNVARKRPQIKKTWTYSL